MKDAKGHGSNKRDSAVKSWYQKASVGKDFQLAASAYGNAHDTHPEGEYHPDFWDTVRQSARVLVDMAPEFKGAKLPKGW